MSEEWSQQILASAGFADLARVATLPQAERQTVEIILNPDQLHHPLATRFAGLVVPLGITSGFFLPLTRPYSDCPFRLRRVVSRIVFWNDVCRSSPRSLLCGPDGGWDAQEAHVAPARRP